MAAGPVNLARDPAVRERVTEELLPSLPMIRDDRVPLRETWLRYHRIWSVKHEIQGYRGRTNTYVPVGKRWIENWVRRAKRDLFPDSDWFALRALHEDTEAKVPAVEALLRYFLRKQMQLKRHAGPWLRQMVLYGTSPARVVWRQEDRMQTALRRVLDAEGRPSGDAVAEAVRVFDYLGPTFRPVDLFSFYVWPTTCTTVDDAQLAFEDLLVPRERIEKLGSTPLDPKNDKAGMIYEGVEEWLETLDGLMPPVDRGGRTTWAANQGAMDKFNAASRRLADKGFTHPLEQKIPVRWRPGDVTECTWQTDLGDGKKRYLVAIGSDTHVLRVQESPWWHGQSQWLCGKFIEVLNEFYGRGLPEWFDHMQYLVNDWTNQTGDALVWSTNPMAIIDMARVQDPTSLRMAPGAKWLMDPNGVEFTNPPQGPAQAGMAGISQVLGMTDTLVNPTPAGAMGSAQRGRGRAQSTAAGMQTLVSEGAVDLRDVTEFNEDAVFEPLLSRMYALAQQFLNDDLVLKITGVDGVSIVTQPVGPADLVGDYEFEWLGSLHAMNVQVRAAQMNQWMMMAVGIPSEVLQQQNIRLNLPYLLRTSWQLGVGLPDSQRVIEELVPMTSIDWRLENQLFRDNRGMGVRVTPKDPHDEHLKGHNLLLQDPDVPHTIKAEMVLHMQDHLQAKAQAITQQQIQQMAPLLGGAPGGPGGGGGGAPGMGAPSANGGSRPPAPLGPGRVAQTGGIDDLFRQQARGGPNLGG